MFSNEMKDNEIWLRQNFEFKKIFRASSFIKLTLGPCLQHSNFLITYIRTQKSGVLHYPTQEWLARDKHSSLMGLFASYK
jgi:hypothetical protein